MASMKKPLLGLLSVSALAAGIMTAAPANAELAASAAVSNMYLWRGVDLGDGSASVSGDLVYKHESGFKTGIWIGSGDSTAGQEYDYFAGYATSFGDLGVDLTLWNYNYSDLGTDDDTSTELSEVVLTLSYAGAAFAYYDNVAGQGFADGADGYEYYTLSYSLGKYSALVGYHDPDVDDGDMTHLDLSYAFNDKLSFTVSQIIDQGDGSTYDEDAKFVLKYSLPIDM